MYININVDISLLKIHEMTQIYIHSLIHFVTGCLCIHHEPGTVLGAE